MALKQLNLTKLAMKTLTNRWPIISFSLCSAKLSTVIQKGSLALQVGFGWFIESWLPACLSRRGEAHHLKRQFEVNAPLKISRRVWTRVQVTHRVLWHLPQCNLPPSRASGKLTLARGSVRQGSAAGRIDVHQLQHSKDKDTLHLNATHREPPWKFYFSSRSFWNCVIMEPHKFFLRKRLLKFFDFPVMKKTRKSLRGRLKPIPTPVQNTLFH